MQLYLKINRPGGKKFLFIDRGKVRKNRDGSRPSIMLYPDRPTEVSNVDGRHLLIQDPHLVSEERPDFSKAFPTTVDEWKVKIGELEKECQEYVDEIAVLVKDRDNLQVKLEKLNSELSEQKENTLKIRQQLTAFQTSTQSKGKSK